MQDKEKDLSADLASARSNVNDALLDSIDLSSALDALFNLVRNVNRYMNEREASAVKDKGVRTLHGGDFVCRQAVLSPGVTCLLKLLTVAIRSILRVS